MIRALVVYQMHKFSILDCVVLMLRKKGTFLYLVYDIWYKNIHTLMYFSTYIFKTFLELFPMDQSACVIVSPVYQTLTIIIATRSISVWLLYF